MERLLCVCVMLLIVEVVFVWGQQGNEEKLQERAIIQLDQKEEKRLFDKGYDAYKANNYKEAIKWFKNVISMNPNSVKAHYNLGLIYQEEKMLDEAIAEYKKALEIYPEYAPAHHNLGMILLDQSRGNDVKGAEHLHKAGLLFLKEGFKDQANNSYNQLKTTKFKDLAQDLFKELNKKPIQKKGEPS